MPWTNDKYIVSTYAKEELPTWDEIYNQFYLNEVYYYDSLNPDHNITAKINSSDPLTILNSIDPYWKIPHRKYLLGVICNQLNKLIFEDGKYDIIINMLKSTYSEIISCKFIIDDNTNSSWFSNYQLNNEIEFHDQIPDVYYCVAPSTGNRSIFASNHRSVNMANLVNCELHLILIFKELNNRFANVINYKDPIFKVVIDELLSEVITYFSNEVGWKNINGTILPSTTLMHRNCNEVGIDPAL